MTMIDVIPREFFDGVAVTLDGGLLAALDEAPAGPWLAEMVEAVDRSRLTPVAGLGGGAARRRGRGAGVTSGRGRWHMAKTKRELTVPITTSDSVRPRHAE